jgi:hypothetical protein
VFCAASKILFKEKTMTGAALPNPRNYRVCDTLFRGCVYNIEPAKHVGIRRFKVMIVMVN